MTDHDAARTALLVLVISVLMELGGMLLAGERGVLGVVAVGLIAFGVMGLMQTVAIAFGRVHPHSRGEHDDKSDRR